MKTRLLPLLVGLVLLASQQVGRSEGLQHRMAPGDLGHIGSSSDGYYWQLVQTQAPVTPVAYDEYDGTGCASGECSVECLDPCCGPKWRVFGEFLYLRPSNEKVAFAVPINGAIVDSATLFL